MKTKIYELGTVKDEDLKFAVIVSKLNSKFLYVRHKKRETLEIPGGHRELGENIDDTAKRELKEETGAIKFSIEAICDYSVVRDDNESYGRVYYAEIEELGELPNLEIGEVRLFDNLPGDLTYPEIQPTLFNEVVRRKSKGLKFNLNSLYICVKDMNRAIGFYEKLLGEHVYERDEVFSIFNINGFRFCLFNNSKVQEEVTWGDNCLPSFEVNDMDKLISKIETLNAEIVFPLTRIKDNLVLEFKDSEGNDIEVYCRA